MHVEVLVEEPSAAEALRNILPLILPEGVFANANMRNVRQFLIENVTIKAIIGLPRDTFKSTGTTAKTAILYLRVTRPRDGHKTFLASIESINGNNSEFERILTEFKRLEEFNE